MNRQFRNAVLWVTSALFGASPVMAQLQGGGLEGSKDLNGGGLDGAGLQTSRLEGGRLQHSSLQGAKLQPVRPQAGVKLLSATSLKRKASALAEEGLGAVQIRGAVSTIPETQVGELLYDVASLLMLQEARMKGVAAGYYMAVLADPDGKRHDDAFDRLKEIFLDKALEHEVAVELYDDGLETMKGLVEIKIGLTEEGELAGLRTLQAIKAAYHKRRKMEVGEKPKENHPETDKPIDAIIEPYRVPLSELKREDVSQQEPPKEDTAEVSEPSR